MPKFEVFSTVSGDVHDTIEADTQEVALKTYLDREHARISHNYESFLDVARSYRFVKENVSVRPVPGVVSPIGSTRS